MKRNLRHTLSYCGVMVALVVGLAACADPAASGPETRDGGALAWSPDGEWIVFPSSNGYITPELYALNVAGALDGVDRTTWLHLSEGFADVIGPANLNAVAYMLLAWSPDGQRIAFSAGDTIYAFDAACLDAPATCADSLTPLIGGASFWVSLIWSPDSTRLLVESTTAGPLVETDKGVLADELVITMRVVVADGSQEVVFTHQTEPRRGPDWEGHPFFSPVWSPDGEQIMYVSDSAGDPDLYLLTLDGGDPVQITDTPEAEINPAWSPDGAEIAYWLSADGSGDIYRQPLDGGPPACVTCEFRPAWKYSLLGGPYWSPDGSQIAYLISGKRILFRRALPIYLYLISADGSRQTALVERDLPWRLAWSPDGSRLAFSFRPTLDVGNPECDIYLINADGTGLTNLPD